VKKLDHKITAMPQWDKTAGQVWDERFEALTRNNDLEKDIDADAHAKIFGLHRATRYVLSIAAAVLLLFTAVSLLYTKEETAGKGRTTSVNLPDGSLAQLSANSRLSYHPLLWFLSHKADLNGEAYFSGTHAKGFTVNTAQGNISVLGTSFNVSTFDNRFVVTCVTGKIAVKSKSESIELTSNMESTILDGRLTARHIANAESAIEWTKGIFTFDDKPLSEVVRYVERYYGIKVKPQEGIDTLRYSGRFTSEKSAIEALTIIGQPFGITFKMVQ